MHLNQSINLKYKLCSLAVGTLKEKPKEKTMYVLIYMKSDEKKRKPKGLFYDYCQHRIAKCKLLQTKMMNDECRSEE